MTFKTYNEAMEWVAEGQAKYGKRAFTARPEYHAAYAEIAALAKAAGARRGRRVKISFGGSLLAHAMHGTQTSR